MTEGTPTHAASPVSATPRTASTAGPDSWAKRYLNLSLGLFMLAFMSIYLGASYYGITPSVLVSHHLDDLHCDLATQGTGAHCFSDFTIVREIFRFPDPWNAGAASTSYSPIAWLPALAAASIGDHLLGGGRAGTILYLFLAGCCLLTPALWAAKGRWRSDGMLILLVTAIGSAPALALLDRGNTLSFAIPSLLMAAVGYQRNDSRLVFFGIVGAALIKPQMVLLAALPLAQRQYRLAFGSAMTAGAMTLVSFFAYPNNFPNNVLGWVRSVMGYNSYQGPEIAYPYNLGAGRSIVTIADTLLVGFGNADTRQALLYGVGHSGLVVSVTCLALGMIVLWLVARTVPRIYSLTIAIMMILLSSSVVAVYYAAPLLVLAALILRDPLAERSTDKLRGVLDSQSRMGRLLPSALVIVTALALAPLVIPTSNPLFTVGIHAELAGHVVGLYQILLGPVLLVFFLLLLIYLPIVDHRARKSASESAQ